MKKIFLTSGIVVCMACPAFATGSGFTDSQTGEIANACTIEHLGVDRGPTRLAAVWDADFYTVTYNKGEHAADGVNNWDDEDGAEYDAPYTPLTAGDTGVAAATGYVFLGYSWDQETANTHNWARNTSEEPGPVNTGTVVNPFQATQSWDVPNDVTVYAAYLPKEYSITYSCGGVDKNNDNDIEDTGEAASGEIANQIVTFDAAYTLNPGTACSLTGYTFNGWSCTNGLSGALDQGNPASGTWGIDSNVTCTAVWGNNTITPIVWEGNGATSFTNNGSSSCTYDGVITVPTKPTKTGYVFGGWKVIPTVAECEEAELAGTPLEGCDVEAVQTAQP